MVCCNIVKSVEFQKPSGTWSYCDYLLAQTHLQWFFLCPRSHQVSLNELNAKYFIYKIDYSDKQRMSFLCLLNKHPVSVGIQASNPAISIKVTSRGSHTTWWLATKTKTRKELNGHSVILWIKVWNKWYFFTILCMARVQGHIFGSGRNGRLYCFCLFNIINPITTVVTQKRCSIWHFRIILL